MPTTAVAWRSVRVACAVAGMLALAAPARAGDDFGGATVIYARGGALYRTDPHGKHETEIAKLPAGATVRALRTDAAGKVLLIDLGGTWSWLPLDGVTEAPRPLPCAAGPASVDEDGTCVLCRAAQGGGAQIVNLGKGKTYPMPIPMTEGARIAGVLPHHRLIWIARGGVWSAPPGNPRRVTKVAPQAPLRDFLASPDGSRALGVYDATIYVNARRTSPGQALMGFELDGQAARRMAIRTGTPVQWSHDSQWVLVQDRAGACLMRAIGGEYKCWKGFTAASIAGDGKYALVFGRHHEEAKPDKHARGKHARGKHEAHAGPAEDADADTGDADAVTDDVALPPPTGTLSLYLARLEGSAYVEPPSLVARTVDGAAVWVPGPAAP